MLTLDCPVPELLSKLQAGTITTKAKNGKVKVRVTCSSFELQWVGDAEDDDEWAVMARHASYIWSMVQPKLWTDEGFLHARSGQRSIKAPLLQEQTVATPMRLWPKSKPRTVVMFISEDFDTEATECTEYL